jgi:hypothetical protein
MIISDVSTGALYSIQQISHIVALDVIHQGFLVTPEKVVQRPTIW